MVISRSFCNGDGSVDEGEDEMNAEERRALKGILEAAALPPVRPTPSEPNRLFGQGIAAIEDLSFDTLVALRQRNQTKQAATGVRTRSKSLDPSTSLRRKIIQEFHDVMNEYKDYISKAAGQDRIARWQNKADSRTGNSANAAAAAATVASKASTMSLSWCHGQRLTMLFRRLQSAKNVSPVSNLVSPSCSTPGYRLFVPSVCPISSLCILHRIWVWFWDKACLV